MPMTSRRLYPLLSSRHFLLGHPCDEFGLLWMRRKWAILASSRNVYGGSNESVPLSRLLSSSASQPAITVDHDIYRQIARGTYGLLQMEPHAMYPEDHMIMREVNYNAPQPIHPYFDSRSPVIECSPSPPTFSVPGSGRSLPLTTGCGYAAYLDQLRKAKIATNLEPSYEEYSKALVMEMDFRENFKEIMERGLSAAMKRGAIDSRGGHKMTVQWSKELTHLLMKDKEHVLKALTGSKSSTSPTAEAFQSSYYSIINILSPSQLAEITVRTVCRRIVGMSREGSIRYTNLSSSVGDEVLRRLRYLELCNELSKARKASRVQENQMKQNEGHGQSYEEEYSNRIKLASKEHLESSINIHRLKTLLSEMVKEKKSSFFSRSLSAAVDRATGLEGWNVQESIRVGGELIHALIKSATIGSYPAFMHQVEKESSHTDSNSHSDTSSPLGQGSMEASSSHSIGVIKMADEAMSCFTRCDLTHLEEQTLPMLIPPMPWHEPMSGGHLSVRRHIARVTDQQHLAAIQAAHERGELSKVYDALTALGQVPWRVNTGVLDIMEKVFASSSPSPPPPPPSQTNGSPDSSIMSNIDFKLWGIKSALTKGEKASKSHCSPSTSNPSPPHPQPETLPHLLKLAASVGLPVNPDLDSDPTDEKLWTSTPFLRLSHNTFTRRDIVGGQLLISSGPPLRNEARAIREKRAETKKLRMELLSLKSSFLLKLEVAKQLRSVPRFFLPHNLDFRGRAYPIHPHLHHMADDVARGLLTFAEPNKLGKDGLRWIMVHVANLYGHGEDKKTLIERMKFAENHMSEIMESAESPLSSESPWWSRGEKPWELLAACLEIKRAKDFEASGRSIEDFPSYLPVHLDGSCNGLQHYAALGKDAACARAVNLLPNPTERPRDVYSAVANAVQKRAERDASPGDVRVSEAVKFLERNGGLVDRKLVKQTVMTIAYGVTLFGAKEQIGNRLRERGWKNEDIFSVSWYLAKNTFDCIDEVFSNANATKDWLAKCAKEVASEGRAVSWTSPMRFPIIQPYVKKVAKKVQTSLQSATIKEEEPCSSSRGAKMRNVDKRAQASAFPPNYVHSLDSSHMMMTAIECRKHGVAFAGVHDSFWTHAGSVNLLNTMLRHAFVDLHSRPLLKELKSELQGQMDEGKILPELPKMGSLDVKEVLNSQYFFS